MKDAIQEQLIAARRNQILDTAALIFAEKGFHSTTIRDIAKAAGIADGTIYNYFENKTALLLGIFERMRDSVMQTEVLPTLDTSDLRSFMAVYLRHPLMGLKADNFALFRVVVSEMLVNEDLRRLYYEKILEPTLAGAEAYFQYLVDQHQIKPVNVSLITRTVSSLMLGLMLQYTMGDETLQAQWDALPEFLADVLLDGLTGDQR